MELFRNILLLTGFDPNAQALRRIAGLVDKSGANLKIMTVTNGAFDQKHDQNRPHTPLHMDSLLRSLNSHGSSTSNTLNALKLRVQTKTVQGEPQQAINKEISRDHHDLIVVDGSYKNIMVSQMLMHAAMHLLRQCHLPVLVSRSAEKNNPLRIMAAVDPSENSNLFDVTFNGLNEKIMELSNAIAMHTGQKVHVMNCWRHPMMERMKKNKKLSDGKIHKILVGMRQQKMEVLTQFLNRNINPQLSYGIHLRQGSPERHIPLVAHDHGVNLVIMGSFGRSGLDGLMVGNTAENILCHTNLSVLVVKPSGYQPVSINAITSAEAACNL